MIEPRDKRYVRRGKGTFTSRQADIGRSLSADRRSKGKTIEQAGTEVKRPLQVLLVKFLQYGFGARVGALDPGREN
jgi:hypothetical protein